MAADTPSEREDLVRLRAKLWDDFDAADPAVSAQIAGRLQAVITRLAELSAPQEATLDDALAERRARRTVGGVDAAGRRSEPAG